MSSLDTTGRARQAVGTLQRLIAPKDQQLRRLASELQRVAVAIGQELERRQVTDAAAAELEAACIDVSNALEQVCTGASLAMDYLDEVLAVVCELRSQI